MACEEPDDAAGGDARLNGEEIHRDGTSAHPRRGRALRTRAEARENAQRTLGAIASMYKLNAAATEDAVVKQYTALLDAVNATVLDRFGGRDFSEVFERFIHA